MGGHSRVPGSRWRARLRRAFHLAPDEQPREGTMPSTAEADGAGVHGIGEASTSLDQVLRRAAQERDARRPPER